MPRRLGEVWDAIREAGEFALGVFMPILEGRAVRLGWIHCDVMADAGLDIFVDVNFC